GLVIYRNKFINYVNVPLMWSAFAINGLGLFFSYARGAWLGFLISLPFFFVKKNKKLFIVSFAVGAAVLGALISFSPTVEKMFLERGGSNEERLAFFETAWVAFKEKPVVGWG